MLLQAALILLALVLAAFAPPARGQMLLISLAGEDASAVAGYARMLGAYPVGSQGNPGVVVIAERALVIMPLLMRGIVPTRPLFPCGSGPGALPVESSVNETV